MEVVLLDPAGAILTKPWFSHNNSQLWNQMSFDLSPWRGQTVQLYFNVYNDGVGGTAAMFLDDVSLTACTGGVTLVPTGGVTLIPSGTSSPTPTPSGTPAPVCVDAIVNGDFTGGLASWQQVGDPAGVTPVTNPVHSTPWAIQLGSLVAKPEWPGFDTPTGHDTHRVLSSHAGRLGVHADPAWHGRRFPASGPTKLLRYADFRALADPVEQPCLVATALRCVGLRWPDRVCQLRVNNDGAGGRTAMVVDDVRLQSCNATPGPVTTPTRTPTRTATPWATTLPVTAIPPIITLTPVPPGCVDLLQNGGFEGGWPPWIVPYNPILPQIVTSPVFSGAFSAQFGSQTQNASSYSSARQWVTIPWSHPRVVLQFWAYTWAQSLSGADRQQAVLLAPGDTVLSVPWKVLQNQQSWQPHNFDLIGLAGQTFAVYFNVINDGVGGRTAMWVDDARLWACSGGAYPPPLPVAVPLPAPMAAPPPVVVVPLDAAPVSLAAVATLAPTLAAAPAPVVAAALAASTPSANITRVAVAPPTQTFAGTAVAPPRRSDWNTASELVEPYQAPGSAALVPHRLGHRGHFPGPAVVAAQTVRQPELEP